MIKKMPMWAWEQLVLAALVSFAMWMQIRLLGQHGPVRIGAAIVIVASGWLTIAAQKTRSMGDRQNEQNKLGGIKNAHMSCASRVASWGLVTQALGAVISVATAPTWAHIGVALYVFGYGPVWRRLYRRWKPAQLEAA